MDKEDENVIPLFPLNVVLFPQGRMKLRIFEQRYLNMVSRCMSEGTGFGVIAISEGKEVGKAAEVHSTGTVAKIVDFERLPEGLLGLTIEGQERFEVCERWVNSDQLQMAEIDYLPEYPDTPALQGHDALASLLKPIFPELQKQYGYDKPNYGSASWVLGRLVEILPAPLSLKTELLAFDDPNEALDHLQEALDRSDQQPTSRRF